MANGADQGHYGSTGLALTGREWLSSHFLAKAHLRSHHIPTLPIHPGDRVLDVACGPGIYTEKFAELCTPGGHVLGVDQDPVLLDQAEATRRRSLYTDQIKFQKLDVLNTSPECGGVDVIIFFNCLSYFPNPETVLERYTTLLNPGGRIIMKDSDFGHFLIEPSPMVEIAEIQERAKQGNEKQSGQFNNFLGRKLYSLSQNAHLGRTYVNVWSYPMFGPLSESEMRYVSGNMQYLADQAELVANDTTTKTWRTVFDPDSNNFLHRKDIFFLMHEIVTVSEPDCARREPAEA